MSSEEPRPTAGSANAEVVRQLNEAFNAGDVERMLAFIHPDFEMSVPPEFSAEPDTYSGKAGMRRYFESFQDAMNEIGFEQLAVEEMGEFVVVDIRLTAVGRTTGIPVEQRLAQVWTVREGQAVEVRNYFSLEEALADAGPAV